MGREFVECRNKSINTDNYFDRLRINALNTRAKSSKPMSEFIEAEINGAWESLAMWMRSSVAVGGGCRSNIEIK